MRAQQYARYHTKSLETNWGVIKALLGKLCTCYETIKDLDGSGTAKDDNILDALDLYKQKVNKNGVFKHCWLRLCTYMRPFNSMLKSDQLLAMAYRPLIQLRMMTECHLPFGPKTCI